MACRSHHRARRARSWKAGPRNFGIQPTAFGRAGRRISTLMNTRSIGITGLRVSPPGEVAAEPRRLAQKGDLGYRRLQGTGAGARPAKWQTYDDGASAPLSLIVKRRRC